VPKKSRAKFEFESTSGDGPVKMTVRASSYLSDDVRSMMIPMIEPAVYLTQRIIGRLRTGRSSSGGANPSKRNGRPHTFYDTGAMWAGFTPKASSPVRVSYSFTGKHPSKTRVGTTKKGKAKFMGNADLARILNSDSHVKHDIHEPSRSELRELNDLVKALLTPEVIASLGMAQADFNAEKKARTALRNAKGARGKGIKKGMK